MGKEMVLECPHILNDVIIIGVMVMVADLFNNIFP